MTVQTLLTFIFMYGVGISMQVETTPRPTARHISLMDGALP